MAKSDPSSPAPTSEPNSPRLYHPSSESHLHSITESDSLAPPPLIPITGLSPQRSVTNSLMNFLPHVPTFLYSKLDMLFYLYADESLDTTVFELAVMELIKDFPAALYELKRILPTDASSASSFSDRGRLYDDTNNYMMWLKDLKQFRKGNLSFQEFKEKVEPHFSNMKDLWKEFDSNFGDANGERANIAAVDNVEISKPDSMFGDTELDSLRSKTDKKYGRCFSDTCGA